MAEDALQCGYCTPGQIVSATALLARVATADARRDPRRHGGEPLPLRRVPEDRARHPPRLGAGRLMTRLVKTQREMEGRFEDVWVLVDEDDDVETWARRRRPGQSSAGRPRVRTGRRAQQGASGTRSTSRCPGCSTRPCCAHPSGTAASPASISTRRAPHPAVRAVLGPETEVSFTTRRAAARRRAAYAGQPIAVVAADSADAARGGSRGARARRSSRSRTWSIPTRRCATSASRATPPRRARGDAEAALAAADVRVELQIETPGSPADAARAACGRRDPGTATGSPPGSRRRACSPRATSSRERFGIRRGPGARDHRVRRRRVRRQAGRRHRGHPGRRARPGHRPPGAARQRPARRAARRRPPCVDAPVRAARCAAATARSSRSTPTPSSRMGQGGWVFPVLVPALTLYRCADVRGMAFPLQVEPARRRTRSARRASSRARPCSSRRSTSWRSRSTSTRSSCGA